MTKDRQAYNAYMNSYMKDRYKERRIEALRSLGGKCVECGSTDNIEVDHIDPNEKSFHVGKIWNYSDGRLQEELAKCQLLCMPCHKEKHSSEYPCGTRQKYWRGCKCEACKADYRLYMKEYAKGK